MPWEVQHQHGVNLPQIGWWLDAQKSQSRSFVSHAHSDHIASHREIIATRETASLMRLRVGGRREEHILGFDEPFAADFGCEVRLYPAGHILGSAMFHATTEHG
ncbi:MAG: hypothetical protein KA788_11370, partial [Lacunisphaera sp.]|nr:hypothetical protein [Lacunisphaera sp.]